MVDGPAFPKPKKRKDAPYRSAETVAPEPVERKVEVSRPETEPDGPPQSFKPVFDPNDEPTATDRSRRLGCVIPLVVLGAGTCIAGGSLIYAWLTMGGRMPFELLIVCALAGPLFLVFARRVYKDPTL